MVHTQTSQRQFCLEKSGDFCVKTLSLFLELFPKLVSGLPHLILQSSWLVRGWVVWFSMSPYSFVVKNLRNVASQQFQIEMSLESLGLGLVRSLRPIAVLQEKGLWQLGLREAGNHVYSWWTGFVSKHLGQALPKHRGI